MTQAGFLLLARTAPVFRSKTALPSWLFRTARFAAQNARKREQRRRHYEEKAAQAMQQQNEGVEDAAWSEIEPLLNQSLAALGEGERQCVLLRFFQEMSFSETGAALGLTEEAARKRVTRALEKIRRIFAKQGVIIPVMALAALLSAHAAKAAPAHLTGEMTKMLAGHVPGHASLIAQGVAQTMNILKWKVAAGTAALFVAGVGTYTLVHSASARTSLSLDDPVTVDKSGFSAPGKKDAVRNVVLSGKVHYEDGRPAGGVQIGAQFQNKVITEQVEAFSKQHQTAGTYTIPMTKAFQEESWNNTVSKSDGTYELPVGAGIPYNVMVFDKTGKWVAAAVEGVSGTQNSIVNIPDLVLTKGCLVIGTVTTGLGIPAPFVTVGSYGPDRPETTAAAGSATSDLSGHYRLRVASGKSRLYVGNVSQTVDLMPGQIETLNFRAP